MNHIDYGPQEIRAADALIKIALWEDLNGQSDVTSTALIPAHVTGVVQIVARGPGVLCGVPIGREVLARVDDDAVWTTHIADGWRLEAGSVIATLGGRVCGLLTAERTILNFMTHLSGIASLTRQFVDAVAGTNAIILDTRKTLPGWRVLQKYAVRCGGGSNHRLGLWDAVLIKDNHLAALTDECVTSLSEVVRVARRRCAEQTSNGAQMPVMIEVDTLEQLRDALVGRPDVVLLDNMNIDQLRSAVALRDESAAGVQLEASGGVSLETVAAIAAAGVDRISVGGLTHSAPALDLGFDWE